MADQHSSTLETLGAISDPALRLRRLADLAGELSTHQAAVRRFRRDTILDLRAEGWTWPEIGRILGVTGARAEKMSHP